MVGFWYVCNQCTLGHQICSSKTIEGYEKWLYQQEREGVDNSLLKSNAQKIDLDDQILVGLRRREGVDLDALGESWGWNQDECEIYMNSLKSHWKEFFETGCLKNLGNRIALSDPHGMEISNQILVEMILWWDSLPDGAVVRPKL